MYFNFNQRISFRMFVSLLIRVQFITNSDLQGKYIKLMLFKCIYILATTLHHQKLMGCGACQFQTLQTHSNTLYTKILQKISKIERINKSQWIQFIDPMEISEIKNNKVLIHQHLQPSEVKRFQAGQQFLLSQERRIIWKIGLYESYEEVDIFSRHQFIDHPQPINEETKQRFYEITLDVNRTFPQVNQLQRQTLSLVLQNLTLYFEGVGYTQGMNFFVGFFLLCGFTAKESYDIFIRLSYNKHYLLIRNFVEGFTNVKLCVALFEELMKKHPNLNVQRVTEKVQEMGLNTFFYSFSWFLSYFLYNLELRSCALVWDYLLLYSSDSQTPSSKQFQTQQNKNTTQNLKIPESASTNTKIRSLGQGLINLLILAINIIEDLSQKIILCQYPEDIVQILRHQAIQKEMTELKIFKLILKSTHQTNTLTEQQFLHFCEKNDQEMFKIIQGLELSLDKDYLKTSNTTSEVEIANNFFNDCKFIKKKVTIKPPLSKEQIEGFKQKIKI